MRFRIYPQPYRCYWTEGGEGERLLCRGRPAVLAMDGAFGRGGTGRQTALTRNAAVPCWWAMLNKWDVIVAGAGLTENDLQEPDVTNVQPYVTPAYSDGR